jgi:hypothetical protein
MKKSSSKLPILEKIIKLAEARNAEAEALEKKHGIHDVGVEILDKNLKAYSREPKPKEKKFTEYLGSLDEDTIVYVASVMYGGRDYLTHQERPKFDDLYNYLTPRAKGLIHSLIEKTPLPDYVRVGIRIFKIK